MGRSRNRVLAARVDELGMTEAEFADAINSASEAITGLPGAATDRYVRKLLAGEVLWPRRHTRMALELALGCPATDLGLTPPPGFSVVQSPSERTVTATAREEDAVDRREILSVAGGMVVSVVVPALPARGRLGTSDVDRLRAPLQQLLAVDDRVGGVALAGAAVRQADRITRALRLYRVSGRVERAVYALVGEYLATAGWLSVDANELDTAGMYLDRALRAASIARDPVLQAQIWNYMAMRARLAHDYSEAHAVAKAGLAGTAARRHPRVAALFNARVAHGHAFRGEPGMAERYLGHAYAAYGRVDAGYPTRPWLAFVDEAQLAALSAIAHLALRRFAQAEDHAREDLRLLRNTYGRNRVHGVLHLAEAHLGRRRIDLAVVQAETALDLAPAISGGLHTGRVARRLGMLRRRLNTEWSSVDVAREWVARYDAAVS